MIEPSPCPFCGTKPVIKPINPEKEGNAWAEIQCIEQTCPANPRISVHDDRGTAKCVEVAIAKWNRSISIKSSRRKEPIDVLAEFLTSIGLENVSYCCIKGDWHTRKVSVVVERVIQPMYLNELGNLATTLSEFTLVKVESVI